MLDKCVQSLLNTGCKLVELWFLVSMSSSSGLSLAKNRRLSKKLKNFSPFSLVSTEVSEGIDWISEMITMLYTLNYSILCNVEDDLWIVDVSLDIVLLYKRLYAVIKVCDGQGESGRKIDGDGLLQLSQR